MLSCGVGSGRKQSSGGQIRSNCESLEKETARHVIGKGKTALCTCKFTLSQG